MTDSKKLDELIRKKGIKLQYLASKLGVTRYALRMKINNISQFKSEEIAILCKILDVTDLEEKEIIFFACKVD